MPTEGEEAAAAVACRGKEAGIEELLVWIKSVARLAQYPVSDGGQHQMRQRKV